jgi:hypothetical protein
VPNLVLRKQFLRKQLILLMLYLWVAGCQTRAEQLSSSKTFYFAIETNTPEEKLLGQDVLHQVSRGLQSGNYVVVDCMKGSQVVNLFSDQASTRGLREAMNELSENQSDGDALIKAVDRAVKLGNGSKVAAMIITSGTADAAKLSWLSQLTEKLPLTTTLYFVGLKPENRLPMSSAFTGVRNRVKFAGLDEEWIAIVNKL